MNRLGLIIAILVCLCAPVSALEPPGVTSPPTEVLVQHQPALQVPVSSAPGGSIGLLKYLPDGTTVEVCGKVVSGAVDDERPTFYVQEPDCSAGIQVNQAEEVTVTTGDVVDIVGKLATIDGETVIQATQVTKCPDGLGGYIHVQTVEPIAMPLEDLGGGAAGYQPAVVNNATTTPVAYAGGINNVGLLVRTWGKGHRISGRRLCLLYR